MSEIKAGDEITIQVKVKVDRIVMDNNKVEAVTFNWDSGKMVGFLEGQALVTEFRGWIRGCAKAGDLEKMVVS